MRVGFAGLGRMGTPMARRLVEGGHDVAVWNRTPDKAEPLLAAGASLAESPSALSAASEVVAVCLSDTAAVREVVFGAHGIADGARPDVVVVDHSSITPWGTREMATRLMADGRGAWLDAPVSGGVAGAAAGSLAVMVGGDEEVLERVHSVLDCYAGSVTRVGGIGAGQTAKLCNQVVVAGTLALVAEAVALAQGGGIDAARLPEALAGGWADSEVLRRFVPRMVDRDEVVVGASALMLKDVETALELALRSRRALPTTGTVAGLYRSLRDAGRGADDLSAIIDALEMG